MYLKKHNWSKGSNQCGWGINSICKCYEQDIINISNNPLLYDLVKDPYEEHKIDPQSQE